MTQHGGEVRPTQIYGLQLALRKRDEALAQRDIAQRNATACIERAQGLMAEIEARDKRIIQLEAALRDAHRAVDTAMETIQRQKLKELGKPHGHDH